MPSLTARSRRLKGSRPRVYPPAVALVELLRPVVYPCTLLPHGQPGVARVNSTLYGLLPVAGWQGDELVIEGYRFMKPDGETHDVQVTRWGLECSCGDATFRQRVNNECKHRACIRQLRERGELV
jgi:hypothetical protein